MEDRNGNSDGNRNISLEALVEKIMAGEKIFIHIAQLAVFIIKTEELRLSYMIKTSVVGGQVILERWDLGRDSWNDFVDESYKSDLTYH